MTAGACSGCYPLINSNWSNVEFTSGNSLNSGGTPLYAWIQSGASDTASSTMIWVNLPSRESTTAPGNVIYMNLMPLNSNAAVTGGYTGYAPLLYCNGCMQNTYGQYDNGVSIFGYYVTVQESYGFEDKVFVYFAVLW